MWKIPAVKQIDTRLKFQERCGKRENVFQALQLAAHLNRRLAI